jgi:hypothetical protein
MKYKANRLPLTGPHNSRLTNSLFMFPRFVFMETKIRTFVSYVMTSSEYGHFGDIWQFHLRYCFPTTAAQILQAFGEKWWNTYINV